VQVSGPDNGESLKIVRMLIVTSEIRRYSNAVINIQKKHTVRNPICRVNNIKTKHREVFIHLQFSLVASYIVCHPGGYNCYDNTWGQGCA